jgi:hypothetical protein
VGIAGGGIAVISRERGDESGVGDKDASAPDSSNAPTLVIGLW